MIRTMNVVFDGWARPDHKHATWNKSRAALHAIWTQETTVKNLNANGMSS